MEIKGWTNFSIRLFFHMLYVTVVIWFDLISYLQLHFHCWCLGRKWENKIKDLRVKLEAKVVTALNEVAWLLNIRGYDIPNNPMVHACYCDIQLCELVCQWEQAEHRSKDSSQNNELLFWTLHSVSRIFLIMNLLIIFPLNGRWIVLHLAVYIF
jgi:hypothetical protein